MAGESKSLAILFADVCDSTRLYEQLGDDGARALMGRCIALMTESIHRHDGTVIKTIGDEVMATFSTADQAADAASDMQSLISSLSQDGQAMAIRVGFHFGPALQEERDVFGDAVNLAARITDQAKAGQVLTTASTLGLLTPTAAHRARHVDRTTLKGKKEMVGVCELLWQSEGVTRSVTSRQGAGARRMRLLLRYRAHEIEMGESCPMVAMGRVASNDLMIQHDLVSRLHARVEHRKGRFTLSDLSTNGTYVVMNGREPQFVRRDHVVLEGSGMIGLGRVPLANSPETIHYELAE